MAAKIVILNLQNMKLKTTVWNHGAFIKISLHVFFKCKKVPQEDNAGLENIKVVCAAIWSYKQSWVCILNINRLVALTQFVVLLHRISRHDGGARERVLFWNLKIASFLYRWWASVASSENDLQCALGPFAAESGAQVWGFSGMSNWDENHEPYEEHAEEITYVIWPETTSGYHIRCRKCYWGEGHLDSLVTL